MPNTTDDNATTWRDLADQLTPKQIAELEYCEREGIPPGMPNPAQGALNCARIMSRNNLVQAMCADIAAPSDAIGEPSSWDEWDDRYGRTYSAAETRASDERTPGGERLWLVDVLGVQFSDGQIERNVTVQVDDEPLTAAIARQLAAALLAAADELDALR